MRRQSDRDDVKTTADFAATPKITKGQNNNNITTPKGLEYYPLGSGGVGSAHICMTVDMIDDNTPYAFPVMIINDVYYSCYTPSWSAVI